MKDHLIIFDTTLRDGEQSPGASMTKEEKVRIAKQLERMKVDIIEAGFPAASNGDFESVKAVASVIKDSTVCGLARALERDIDRAGEAVKGATSSRIHTFLATSPIHMEKKLRMTPDQVLEQAVKAVHWARKWTDNVEFSPRRCRPLRIGFFVPRAGSGDRGGRHHGEYSGYRGLQHAATIRRADRTICAAACRIPIRRCSRCIATMIWAWPWPIHCRPCSTARAKSNAPSMAWANVPAMLPWKKW